MDHSQHTLHNHEHHVMYIDLHAGHDHGQIISSTLSPLETAMPEEDRSAAQHHHAAEMSHADGGHSSPLHHMMSMSFHFGYDETILFSWWKIDSVPGLIGSMIAIFLVAVLYEGLKYYREYLFWKTYNLLEYRPVTGPSQQNPESPSRSRVTPSTASPVQYVGEVIHKQPPTMFSLHHIFQTFLHMLQVTISFLLMLIFMTYNVWLCLAVVLGAAVGYFLFCWKKSVIVDVTEHCH